MSTTALALVLLSALSHATWNLLAKRVEGGAPFLWLVYAGSALVYAPLNVVVVLLTRPSIGASEIGLVLGTTLLHTAYFFLLTRGYRAGDLSLVYPLARATGPLLSTAAAIALLGERPTPLALAGALAIVTGAVVLAGDPRKLRARGAGAAVAYALATGVLIAGYTLWDKQAISAFLVPPLLYDWGRTLGQTLLLAPVALAARGEIRRHWREHRKELLGIAVLSPLSYILVLIAFTTSPVSYVAPAREVGILFGAVLGTRLLAEGQATRRIGAAAAMVVGVVALALG